MRCALLSLVLITFGTSFGCASLPDTVPEQQALENDVQTTITKFKRSDPAIEKFFDTSAGYAVFPGVTKGAWGVGGAHGLGVLYESGELVGDCELTQMTVGWQLGGQSYSEVIFFQTEYDVDVFKGGDFAFAGQVSAVAATLGASKDVNYENGVVVFTMTNAGLMYEASIGGQKFNYVPLPASLSTE